MSIYIQGKTFCPLCQLPVGIDDPNQIIIFDNFVPNELDPLSIFNGAICHISHFDAYSRKDEVIARINERNEMAKNYKCYISGTDITIENFKNPANFIFIERIIDDKENYLHKFNYKYLNKYYLKPWPELPRLISELEALNKPELWKGPYLGTLIHRLKSPLHPEWDEKMREMYRIKYEQEE